MLLLLSWLFVYTWVLFALSRVASASRGRQWFKLLFLPGMFLAVVAQSMASRLTVACGYKVALFADKKPPFELEKKELPWLNGALFALVTHGILYVAFVTVALWMEARCLLAADHVTLPGLHLEKLADAQIDLRFGDYLRGLSALRDDVASTPLAYGALLWVLAGFLASTRFQRQELIWSWTLLLVVGLVYKLAAYFGAGFPVFSLGWWAEFSYFPRCWNLFSLYLTLCVAALALFLLPALPSFLRKSADVVAHGGEEKSPGKKGVSKPAPREKAHA